MVSKIFIISIILISSSNISAQEITVNASTDTTDYMIGDQIKYSLVN